MKKKVILIVALVAMGAALFAGKADTRFSIGLQNSEVSLVIPDLSDPNLKFNAKAEAEFKMILDNDFGFYVSASPDFGASKFGLGAGMAYKCNFGKSTDCILEVGPTIAFGGNVTRLGAELMANIDISLTQKMFIELGFGAQLEFAQIYDGNTRNDVSLYMPLPAVSLGWKF
jgi:hypothetical protein